MLCPVVGKVLVEALVDEEADMAEDGNRKLLAFVNEAKVSVTDGYVV
jgi:hypothetical protein